MKIIKHLIPIISIVCSGFILFQSCASGILNSINQNGNYSGTLGVLLVMFMLVGSILLLTVHSRKSTIISGIFYFLGGFCALMSDTGAFTDLVIWGWMSFIFGAIIMIVGACES